MHSLKFDNTLTPPLLKLESSLLLDMPLHSATFTTLAFQVK